MAASPPFDYDESSPGNDDTLGGHPENERTFRDNVKSALAIEHHETQGTHAFNIGSSSARDTADTSSYFAQGAVWIEDDGANTGPYIHVRTGNTGTPATDWEVPILETTNAFTKANYTSNLETLTIASGVVTWDWADSNYFYCSVGSNITTLTWPDLHGSPLDAQAAYGTWILEFDQTAAYTLAFDGSPPGGHNWIFPFGFNPGLRATAGKELWSFTRISNGDIAVTALQELGVP